MKDPQSVEAAISESISISTSISTSTLYLYPLERSPSKGTWDFPISPEKSSARRLASDSGLENLVFKPPESWQAGLRARINGVVGQFSDHFGTILEAFWDNLGPFWDHFGSTLGQFLTVLDPFWDHFGTPVKEFGVDIKQV